MFLLLGGPQLDSAVSAAFFDGVDAGGASDTPPPAWWSSDSGGRPGAHSPASLLGDEVEYMLCSRAASALARRRFAVEALARVAGALVPAPGTLPSLLGPVGPWLRSPAAVMEITNLRQPSAAPAALALADAIEALRRLCS